MRRRSRGPGIAALACRAAVLGLAFALVHVAPGRADTPDDQWGPFRGRVVDADTRAPVVGAIVLVVWQQILPTPVHGVDRFYDARAAVAGRDGSFEIARRPPPLLQSRITRPLFDHFAPGYVPEGFERTRGSLVFLLRRRTRLPPDQQRIRSSTDVGVLLVPDDRLQDLLRAINRKRMALGLRPIERPLGRL